MTTHTYEQSLDGDLRVLVVHNRYVDRGGEDEVVDAEVAMMRDAGWMVALYERDSAEIDQLPRRQVAKDLVWSTRSARDVYEMVVDMQAHVVHVHNTLPLISPSVLSAARRAGAAIVQTQHNFRPDCLNGLYLHDGQPCQRCHGRNFAYSGVARRCYRGSGAQSGALAVTLAAHRMRRTWQRDVDAYIAPSQFVRERFIEAGTPGGVPVYVKPNFVPIDPDPGDGDGEYMLFVGRLAREKGVDVLCHAWRCLEGRVPLRIVGDGPMREMVETLVAAYPDSVRYEGRLSHAATIEQMRDARALVAPSRFYETFCLTAAESFAARRPVIASNHGALAELVTDGATGWHVAPGDAGDLASAVADAWFAPDDCARRGRAARDMYEQRFAASRNIATLQDIYDAAIHRRMVLA